MSSSGDKATWLDQSSPWPEHARPEAQKALKRARKAGWLFRPSKGHTFGWIKCGHTGGPLEECRKSILTTSGKSDGSTTAKVIDDALRKCPHGTREMNDDEHDVDVDVLLMRIEGLVAAAEHLLERDRDGLRALAALDDDTLADDDSRMAEAEAADSAAVQHEQLALSAAHRDRWDGWPPLDGAREVLARAAELRELVSTLPGVDEPAFAHAARLHRIDQKVATIRLSIAPL